MERILMPTSKLKYFQELTPLPESGLDPSVKGYRILKRAILVDLLPLEGYDAGSYESASHVKDRLGLALTFILRYSKIAISHLNVLPLGLELKGSSMGPLYKRRGKHLKHSTLLLLRNHLVARTNRANLSNSSLRQR